MKKRSGKLKKAIIEILQNDSDHSFSVNELVSVTGSLQPSVCRAINGLIDDGLVTKEKDVYAPLNGRGLNRWQWLYKLNSNEDK